MPSQVASYDSAIRFMTSIKGLYRMADPASELTKVSEARDTAGHACIAMQQLYKGVPVSGSYVQVGYAPGGTIDRISSTYTPDIGVEAKSKITADGAIEAALKDAGAGSLKKEIVPELGIYRLYGNWYLVWNVMVYGSKLSRVMSYYVNAADGSILAKSDALLNYTPIQVSTKGYYAGYITIDAVKDGDVNQLIDTTRGYRLITCTLSGLIAGDPGPTNISQDTANWSDCTTHPRWKNRSAEVDVHVFLGQAVDHFAALDPPITPPDMGVTDVYAGAHDYEGTSAASSNGSWTDPVGKKFYFGDGDGVNLDYFTANDIVGHEYTHLVTSSVCKFYHACKGCVYYQNPPDSENDLLYGPGCGQSNALSEAFSNIFATFIDTTKPDGSIDTDSGEDIIIDKSRWETSYRLNDPSSPKAFMRMIDHMAKASDTYGKGYQQCGNPVLNQGPVIYAAFLMMYGGTHPNSHIKVYPLCNDPVESRSIGEKIWYYAMRFGGLSPKPDATFMDCRNAVITAARALYPDSLSMEISITDAFAAVGIGERFAIPFHKLPIFYAARTCWPWWPAPPWIKDIIVDPEGPIDPLKASAELWEKNGESPDILVSVKKLAEPLNEFRQPPALSTTRGREKDRYAYLRLHNSSKGLVDMAVNLFICPANTVADVTSWKLLGSARSGKIKAGSTAVVEFTLPDMYFDRKAEGGQCLVAQYESFGTVMAVNTDGGVKRSPGVHIVCKKIGNL